MNSGNMVSNMTMPQMRLVSAAYQHGAVKAGATAMHGWARFHTDKQAVAFAEIMLAQQWAVQMYQQNDSVAVDWTCERMSNGQITPIRSEAKHNDR